MDRTPNSHELQTFHSHGVAPFANTGPGSPPPGRTLAAPTYATNATTSAGNSSARLDVPKLPNARSAIWKTLYKWWPELAGAISSVVLLIAIVVFLVVINGSKLDDWHLAWQIKPPTIISILVTLCRINLAFFIAEGIGQLKWVFFEQREHQLADFEQFDEATRGPWGAICFIWKVNRRALVATCGAIMAILILAMDPFSQQVLYYASQTSSVGNGVATIPSAQFYDSGALYTALSGTNNTASFNPDPKPPSLPDDSEMTSLTNDCATCGLASPTTIGSIPLASQAPGFSTYGKVKRDETKPEPPKGTRTEVRYHPDTN